MTFILGVGILTVCAVFMFIHTKMNDSPQPIAGLDDTSYGSGSRTAVPTPTYSHYQLPYEGTARAHKRRQGATKTSFPAADPAPLAVPVTMPPPPQQKEQQPPQPQKILEKSDSDEWGWFVI